MKVTLVFFKDGTDRKDIPVSGPSAVLGRDKACHIRVPLPSVSREHCKLAIEGDRLTVKDLGSSNGTFVNGEKVTGAEDLAPGDQLSLGSVIFTVQINGEPANVEPPLLEAPSKASPDDTGPDEMVAAPAGGDDDASDDSDEISDLIRRATKAVNEDSSAFDFDFNIDDDDEDDDRN